MVRCRDPSCKLKCGSNDHSTPECTLNERDTEPVESDPEPEDESTSWNGNDNSEDEAASELDKEKKVICRLCATSDNTCIPIFTERGMELELYIKIPKYLPVELHKDDDMPSQICTSCVTAVTAWHEFATVCTKTEMELKKRFCTRTTQNTSLFKRKLGNTENSSGSNKRMCLRSREPTKEKDDNMRTASEEEDIQTHDKSEIFIVETDNEDMHCDDNFSGGEESDCVDISRDEEKTGKHVEDTAVHKTSHVSVVEDPSSFEGVSSGRIHKGGRENRQAHLVIQCKICNIKFPTFERLIEHNMALHADNPYHCNICSKVFSDEAGLRAHEIKKHNFKLNAGNLINTCPVCSSTVFHPYFLKHLTTHPYFCMTCFKDFGSWEGFREHKKSHLETVLCNKCGMVVKLSTYFSHMKAHDSEVSVEETLHDQKKECDKLNIRETKCDKAKNQENKCEVCNETFKSPNILKKHMRVMHPLPYNSMCEICGRIFYSPSGFKIHYQFSHQGERQMYECFECGKAFKIKESLQFHLENLRCYLKKSRTNSDINRQCEKCGKYFKLKSGLATHMKTHAAESLKKYVCEVCGRCFNYRSALRGHRFLHQESKPYKCDFCEKTFINKVGKENHERSKHTGERPFVCKVCGKSYTARKTYVAHATIHSSSKTYKCKLCDEVFPNIPQRIYHTRKHFRKSRLKKQDNHEAKGETKKKVSPSKPKKNVGKSKRSKKSVYQSEEIVEYTIKSEVDNIQSFIFLKSKVE